MTGTEANPSVKHLVPVALFLGALLMLRPASHAFAYENPSPVGLGAAGAFTVLAAATVTNSGTTVISADAGIGGNLGVSPGTAVTGFPPGVVLPPGMIHAGNATAQAARTAAGAAYDDAASRTPDVVFTDAWDLVGQTFTAGVYRDRTSLALSGTVTLDGGGDPDAVFIFQAGSTLVTAAGSRVLLTNGAQACNVFWQVGSSATLGAASAFNGTILASTSISVGDGTGADIQGRLLAGTKDITGAVTLISDRINTPACAPESGIPIAPIFGQIGSLAAPAAFLVVGGVFMARRRLRAKRVR